ncbi:TPA: U32 family peptidase [Candidatus Ventrenecus avicola]|nr:U32 family peptidase [Candidatus Ventrenecus avicola]
MKKELLIPAGNMDALKIAVLNGADAVYIGGKLFGARAFAQNFTEEEIIEAKSFCHLYGVKLYVTVNTMVYQSEWEVVTKYIKFLYQTNVDAVIVSDLGLISYIHETYPNMEIHVSTQAHTYLASQFDFYQELGVKRVVLDRELSLEEIDLLPNTLEKEVFIHGALCVSYSGECLMSALKGGRSGNRGSCAQVCRLLYTLNYHGEKMGDKKYYLSTKELNTSAYISELFNSSITSFKVEGRMKSREYVAFITQFYRTLIDQYQHAQETSISSAELKKLKTLFNRGFTKGYLMREENIMNFDTPNHQGIVLGGVTFSTPKRIQIKLAEDLTQGDGIRFKEIQAGMIVNFLYDKKGNLIHEAKKGDTVFVDNKVGLNRKATVLKTSSVTLSEEIANYPKKTIPIQMVADIDTHEFTLRVTDGVHQIVVTKDICEKAKTKSMEKEDILKQLNRLKDTPFFLEKVEIHLEPHVFIPVSNINEIRRCAIDGLTQARKR